MKHNRYDELYEKLETQKGEKLIFRMTKVGEKAIQGLSKCSMYKKETKCVKIECQEKL